MTEYMPETNIILLASNNPAVVGATQQVLEVHESIHLVNRSIVPSLLYQVIAEIHPDIILVDFGSQRQPYYLVNKITREYPVCKVIAVLPPSKATHANRAVQAGAHAAVHYPYESDHMEVTILNIMDSLGKSQVQTSNATETSAVNNHTNTYTIFSPKGGTGSSTIATNLAISLHKKFKEDVLLIDGKFLFGHVALYLNLRTGNSISDLVPQAGMLDQRLIKQVVVRHSSGIHVLPSPITISDVQAINPENLYQILQSLQLVFPNIVIDAGSHIDENTVTLMDAASKILLVLNPDMASVRDARQFDKVAAALSYPPDKTLLILNMKGTKVDINHDEIEKLLDHKLFGKVPADETLAISCLNDGVPILLKKPSHSISKAINEIAEDLSKRIHVS